MMGKNDKYLFILTTRLTVFPLNVKMSPNFCTSTLSQSIFHGIAKWVEKT